MEEMPIIQPALGVPFDNIRLLPWSSSELLPLRRLLLPSPPPPPASPPGLPSPTLPLIPPVKEDMDNSSSNLPPFFNQPTQQPTTITDPLVRAAAAPFFGVGFWTGVVVGAFALLVMGVCLYFWCSATRGKDKAWVPESNPGHSTSPPVEPLSVGAATPPVFLTRLEQEMMRRMMSARLNAREDRIPTNSVETTAHIQTNSDGITERV